MLKTIVGVGAIVLNSNAEILLGERTKPGEDVSWSLPGGHVERGETFAQAALREVEEECGIRAVNATALSVLLDMNSESTHLTSAVLIRLRDTPTPINREPHNFRRWKWFNPCEIPSNVFPPSDAVIRYWLAKAPLLQRWVVYSLKNEGEQG